MLIDLGFDVEHAKNVGSKGKPDKGIVKFVKEQDVILVTKDLGNILWYDEENQIELPFFYMADLYRLIIWNKSNINRHL